MVESAGSGELRQKVEQVARDINDQVGDWIELGQPPTAEQVRAVAAGWVGQLGQLGLVGSPQPWYRSPVSSELAERFYATYLASDDVLLKAVARQLVQPAQLGDPAELAGLAQAWQTERLRQIDSLADGARQAPEPGGGDAAGRAHRRARAENQGWTLPNETAAIQREQLFALTRQSSDVIRASMAEHSLSASDVATVATTIMTEANLVFRANAALAALAETPPPLAPSPAESPQDKLTATRANLARLDVTARPYSLEAMRLAVLDVPTRFGALGAKAPPAPIRDASPGANHRSLDYAREDTLVNRIGSIADTAESAALLRLVAPHIQLEQVPRQSAGTDPGPVRAEAVEFVRARLEQRFVDVSRWSETMSPRQFVEETAQLAALTRDALIQVSTLNAATGAAPRAAAVALGPAVGMDASGRRDELSHFPVGGQAGQQVVRDGEDPGRKRR